MMPIIFDRFDRKVIPVAVVLLVFFGVAHTSTQYINWTIVLAVIGIILMSAAILSAFNEKAPEEFSSMGFIGSLIVASMILDRAVAYNAVGAILAVAAICSSLLCLGTDPYNVREKGTIIGFAYIICMGGIIFL